MDASELIGRYAVGERDFTGVCLESPDLSGVNLAGANLSGANLRTWKFIDKKWG